MTLWVLSFMRIVEHMENNFEGIAASDVVVKSCVEKCKGYLENCQTVLYNVV